MKKHITNVPSLKNINEVSNIPDELVMAMRVREFINGPNIKKVYIGCKHTSKNYMEVKRAIKHLKDSEYYACVYQTSEWKNDSEIIFIREK